MTLSKSLREAAGIGDVAEAREGEIFLKPFRPREVDIDPKIVEQILREGSELERRKIDAILKEIRS